MTIEKMDKDHELLKSTFMGVGLKKDLVEKSVESLSNLSDFFQSSYSVLTFSVKNLKEIYGDAIKWKTIVLYPY
jgi:hypothetical protein